MPKFGLLAVDVPKLVPAARPPAMTPELGLPAVIMAPLTELTEDVDPMVLELAVVVPPLPPTVAEPEPLDCSVLKLEPLLDCKCLFPRPLSPSRLIVEEEFCEFKESKYRSMV